MLRFIGSSTINPLTQQSSLEKYLKWLIYICLVVLCESVFFWTNFPRREALGICLDQVYTQKFRIAPIKTLIEVLSGAGNFIPPTKPSIRTQTYVDIFPQQRPTSRRRHTITKLEIRFLTFKIAEKKSKIYKE